MIRGASHWVGRRAVMAGGGLPAFLLATWLVAGAGCTGSDDVAGGDDFPNGIEVLGKAAAAEMADTSSWNAYQGASAESSEAYDSTRVPDEPPDEASVLGRRAVVWDGGRVLPGFEIEGAVRLVSSVFDALTEMTRVVREQTVGAIVVRDTSYFRLALAPPLRRMVKMSGVVVYPDRVERFAFEDADGDGVLSPLGPRSRVRARFVVERPAGVSEHRVVTLAAGADGSFETVSDNLIFSVETIRLAGADTLAHVVFVPVAGDSVVRDPQRGFTSADVRRLHQAEGVRMTQEARVRMHADPARNRVVRFRQTVTDAAGTTGTIALGRDSLPDFAAGDTGTVRVTFVASDPSAPLVASTAVYQVALADSVQGHAGNRLLGLRREKTYRSGPEETRQFHYVGAAPARAGEALAEGGLAIRVDLRAGGWVAFEGQWSAAGLEGIWTTGSDSGSVRFDGTGAVLSVRR